MLPPLMAELKQYMKTMGYKSWADMRDLVVKEITPATKLTIHKGYARKKNEFLRGPCQAACPFSVPAQDYVTLVADGDIEQAYQQIASRNPLQSVCGWACNHPCEKECTRGQKDEPIRIKDIKRFVIERAAKEGWHPIVERGPKREQKVAVVGSGPAGLSAAFHLARAGYPVTVFESREKTGGALRYAIPRFRLPESVLDAEVNNIANMGVTFTTGKEIGDGVALDDLKKQGFSAAVMAVGASRGLPVGVTGEKGKGCMTALDFLDMVSTGAKVVTGKRVAVIGGGFTAVDAARTAVRLGAQEVYILYRRTRPEMPATTEEVDDAEAEGVKIMYLVAPKKVIRANGKVKALLMQNYVLAEPDASGRRRPEEVEGTQFTLKVDTIITAVSQGLAQDQDELGVRLSKDGRIASKDGVVTSKKWVFTAGDAVTGPDSIIAAVSGGYRAAVAVDKFLAGDGAYLKADPKLDAADKEMALLRQRDMKRKLRVEVRERAAEKRSGDFETYLEVMSEPEAVAEAARCLRCGCSVTCGQCSRICSSFAISLQGEAYSIDKEKCHACGMCAQLCPNKNIEMVSVE
jgi:formate dehydrogenase major subunit